MTNKYQEALDDILGGIVDIKADTVVAIYKALQAGAEGRILPKHDTSGDNKITRIVLWRLGLSINCTIIADNNFTVEYEGYASNYAEAMQNAIDKIGGAV